MTDHDCYKHLDKARHVSRAKWVCPECGEDVSVAYVLLREATARSKDPEFPSFDDWLGAHGCDRRTLWYLQNCLGSLYGFDSENARQARRAWRRAQEQHAKDIADTMERLHNMPDYE